MQTKITTIDRWDGTRLVPRGQPVQFADNIDLSGDHNLVDIPSDFTPAVVEVAAIGPTGPNPTQPQQLPHDAVQTTDGYAIPGARLVGEVTLPQETRIDAAGIGDGNTAQADVAALMDTAGNSDNGDDALVAGTVSEVTADLGGKTDEELTSLRAAEIDREKPRKGVISAIDAELDSRKS